VRELGYTDVRQFARVQAMNLLNRRVREQEILVQSFEQKYGADWHTFSARTESASAGIIEREDDEMAWEAALTYLIHLRQRLQLLQEAS
jgi:hypothetical protein